MRIITLTEIAERAGVSVATVSNALSGKGRMRDDLRRRIVQFAREMGYDMSREHGMSATAPKIAILAEQLGIDFCSIIIEGISIAAIERKCHVAIYNMELLRNDPRNCNPDKTYASGEIRRVLEQIGGSTYGMIYVSQFPRNIDGLLPSLPFPVVYTYCYSSGSSVCINYNDKQGALLATRHLLNQGCRHIAMISGQINSIPMIRRFSGYQQALVEAGMEIDLSLVRTGEWSSIRAYNDMKDLLCAKVRPDGVFCQSDQIALGAIRAIREQGLRIPEDIAIIGFDDMAIALASDPPLSSIATPCREIGMQACNILLDILSGKHPENNNILLDCTLLPRKSSLRIVPEEMVSDNS